MSSSSSINLSSLNGTIGFRLDGNATNDNSGLSVAAPGDLNGPGGLPGIPDTNIGPPTSADRASFAENATGTV